MPRLPRWVRPAAVVVLLLLAALSALGTGSTRTDGRPVVVAARDVAAGAVLAASDLRVEHWPAGIGPPDVVADPAALTGRRTAGAIGRGEAVTADRTLGTDLLRGARSGDVVVSVAVLPPPGGSALVQPGTTVDLLASSSGADAPATGAAPSGVVVGRAVRVVTLLPSPAATTSAQDATQQQLVVAVDDRTARDLAAYSSVALTVAVHPPP